MLTGVVPVGVAMEAKKGSEVCVCVCVCIQTHMHVGVWERKCVHLMNGHVPELNSIHYLSSHLLISNDRSFLTGNTTVVQKLNKTPKM